MNYYLFKKKKDIVFLKNGKARLTGFTLVELLVVVAIIGLFASIVLVYLAGTRSNTRDIKGEAEINQIMRAFEMKYTGDGKYPDLPDEVEEIPSDDTRLSPHLSPTPYTNGNRNYQWYNGGDEQKFCLFFEYETRAGFFTCSHRGCYVNDSPVCPKFDD